VFRRVGNREVTGSGIGLSICRTIVESAGGKIWAEGRPNEGATFYISWPARISSSASNRS
jgi:signal transduction histidine kinase